MEKTGRLEVTRDDEHKRGGEADGSRLGTSVFPHSRRPIYALPAQSKHCSARFEQTRPSWETQTAVFLFPLHCLPLFTCHLCK